MSRGFVKDGDIEEVPAVEQRAWIPDGVANLVTPEGLASLNAERECRQMENYASVLRERSVLLEEERYSISSKGEIERMLQERGIVMIDLSSQSRLVDK